MPRYKMLVQLKIGNMSLNACIDLVQQELIQTFNKNENRQDALEVTDTYSLKRTVVKCPFC